jgi:DHA2 family multidrug resistance protein-like MFS transporter
MSAADGLEPGLAAALREAAAHAFDSGVVVTALIGAGLIVIAAVVAATTLKGSKAVTSRSRNG